MTTETEKRYVFVVDKKPFAMNYKPRDLDGFIDKREVLKETPKGLRLSIGYADNGTMFLFDRHEFFDTYEEALYFLDGEANEVLEHLKERTTDYQVLHSAIRHAILKWDKE